MKLSQILESGEAVVLEDIRLEIDDIDTVSVTGWSRFVNFSNLRRENCIKELEEIKIKFASIKEANSELTQFLKAKDVEYVLDFDDNGKGSVLICSERNGIMKWNI